MSQFYGGGASPRSGRGNGGVYKYQGWFACGNRRSGSQKPVLPRQEEEKIKLQHEGADLGT